MVYSTGSHTGFYHRYHVVWSTKYRYKVLQGAMRERIREIIRQACAEMGVHIVKGVLARDHVHMFIRHSPSGMPLDVKIASFRLLIKRFGAWTALAWARTLECGQVGPQTRIC